MIWSAVRMPSCGQPAVHGRYVCSHRLERVVPLKTQNYRGDSPAVRNTQDWIGQGLFQDPRTGTHLKSCKMRLQSPA